MNSRAAQAQQVMAADTEDPDKITRRRIIDLEGVSVTYEAQRGEPYTAVENIDLSVQEREFVSLIGPSGCGKSTLLKVITGNCRALKKSGLRRWSSRFLRPVSMLAVLMVTSNDDLPGAASS